MSGKYEEESKIWNGPVLNELKEISKWPSVGHFFLNKLDGEFANTVLFVSNPLSKFKYLSSK